MKTSKIRFILSFVALSSSFTFLHAADSTPVAKIGNTVLTEEELRKEMGMSLYEIENQLYMTKKNWVDQKARTILMAQAAKDAKMSVQAWQKKEIDDKIAAPTQQEIDQWAPRFGMQGSTATVNDAAYNAMKEKAKQYLATQKRAQREMEVFQQLTQRYGAPEVMFTKPEAPKVDVTYNKFNPVKGPKDAQVTIIEFTDFECPWCKKSQDSVKAVEQTYGNKIKMVDRMFPLTTIHPRAMPAAEAAYCAKDQGKYWEMREKLFASSALSDEDFKTYAKELGLNMSKFNTCMSTHKSQADIQTDMQEAQKFGVRGTPSFFVNGAQTGFPQLSDAVKAALEKK